MSAGEFAALFALAQAAPGPNMLVVTLVGWQVAGLPGAMTATGAFVVPSGILAYFVANIWQKFRTARWRRVVQAGITPVTVGLIMAAGILLCRAAIDDLPKLLLVIAVTATLLLTRLHPLWMLGTGAALGAAGLL
jgi:chromate transporter